MQNLNHLLRSNVKFKHLHLLVTMREVLHVGKVAELMHMSQPAVSKTLAEIESLVGVTLFDRTSRGLTTTAQGELFVQFAEETLSKLDRVAEDLVAARLGISGTVHVGSMTTATALLLPMTVNLLKQRSPHTTVRIDDGLMEPMIERLNLGQLDLIIGRLDALQDTTGLVVERLYQDSVQVVASYGSELAARKNLAWPDLCELPWILPPSGSLTRRRFDEASAAYGMGRPKDLVETSSFLAMVKLIRERSALCLMSQSLARYCESEKLARVLPLESVVFGSPIGIVRVEGRRERPNVALFVECLRHATQDIAPVKAPN